MAAMQPHWDIFCRVIDNYGDIGVCWRLARQLRAEHGLIVRLWVDDLNSLRPLCPAIDPLDSVQIHDGITIHRWDESFPVVQTADVVVEAFGCELPASYLQSMARRRPAPRWVNLEYLSAEAWVEDCHGLASPHPTLPLTKHFFFPGFTPMTGGLLRERGLLEERDAHSPPQGKRDLIEVSLFCYDTAPVGELLHTWAAGEEPIRCLVPPGKPLQAVMEHLGGNGPWRRGYLEVVSIPFVPQADFDQLLWRCDVNFVRGEDSFIRAQWAARPFVWQIYPQHDDVHIGKLDAFLARYAAGLPGAAADAVTKLFHAWNTGNDVPAAWAAFATQRSIIEAHGVCWAATLASQADLATRLVKFCSDGL